jgi:hypothetical protein
MAGHADVVARIKAELQGRGVSLVGPCGAFQITKRVAWELRGEGAGLLSKPQGNNCEGFATDIIAFQDGRIFDILANAGGDEDASGNPIPGTGNVPVWNEPSDGQRVDPARWRAAIDPGDTPSPKIPTPTTGSGAPGSTTDTDRIVAAIEKSTASILTALKENTETLVSVRKGLEQSLGALLPALMGRPR